MANKYLIHGATYCGDGTASNEAASAGAAGAWNDINVFEGTAPAFGSLAAGDVVYIRSKNAAGADISRSVVAATTLGSASGTTIAPITWVLDGGNKWSGVDGLLTYTSANTSYNFVIRANNIIGCETQSALRFVSTVAAPSSSIALVSIEGILKKARVDWSAKTNTNNLVMMELGDFAVVEYPELKLGACGTTLGYSSYGTITSKSNTVIGRQKIVGIDYEISGSSVGQAFVGPRQYYSLNLEFVGGRIYGTGASAPGAKLADMASADNFLFYAVGLKIPRTMLVWGGYAMPSLLELVACEDGYGGHVEEVWGYISTRTDNNPPTRNTTLPDSAATKWAARLYPSRATVGKPFFVKLLKTYSGAAAVKTVNLEVQVSDDFSPQPTTATVWMDVTYIDDATGLEKKCTTVDPSATALTAGATDWSSNGWYLTSLTPKRLSVTTPTSVRQDTPVIVVLMGTTPALAETQVYFVDADFDLI